MDSNFEYSDIVVYRNISIVWLMVGSWNIRSFGRCNIHFHIILFALQKTEHSFSFHFSYSVASLTKNTNQAKRGEEERNIHGKDTHRHHTKN